MCKYCTKNFRERDRYIEKLKPTDFDVNGFKIGSISLDGDGYHIISFYDNKRLDENGDPEHLGIGFIISFTYCPFCGKKLGD